MNCHHCLKLLRESARFCGYCGAPVPLSPRDARQVDQPIIEPAGSDQLAPTFTNHIGLAFALIPAGSFLMGGLRDDEKPAHEVNINSSFYLAKFQTTQRQWQRVMKNNPSRFVGDKLPVEQISWDYVQIFIAKLNEMDDGYEYRLPSEAEWEYACRAGTTGEFYGELDSIAWHRENSRRQTNEVGTKQPNAFGLHDMSGNVREWCEDAWHDNYEGAPTDGSSWMSGGDPNQRAARGGSWWDSSYNLESASRFGHESRFRDSVIDTGFIGFRLVAAVRQANATNAPAKDEVETPGADAKQLAPAFANRIGISFALIPAGRFLMGGDDSLKEKPMREVRFSYSFYLGKYPVTQAQWDALMEYNPSYFTGDNLPVEQVSWDGAKAFIAKLNEMDDGYEYRLPSEAEWEYACRAGTTGDYYSSVNAISWHHENSDQKTHEVGTKKANRFGLCDMSGNVFEWCEDARHENYEGAPTDGSSWMSGGDSSQRVARGGSWWSGASCSRSASREWLPPDEQVYGDLGFRVVAVARQAATSSAPADSFTGDMNLNDLAALGRSLAIELNQEAAGINQKDGSHWNLAGQAEDIQAQTDEVLQLLNNPGEFARLENSALLRQATQLHYAAPLAERARQFQQLYDALVNFRRANESWEVHFAANREKFVELWESPRRWNRQWQADQIIRADRDARGW